MKAIEIFWWKWQHASDLQKRGIFQDINSPLIDKEDNISSEIINSAIIVPISETKSLIESIIENNNEQNIINFSWVMSTTPKDIRNNHNISNFHFLFWPNINKSLKVAFAWKLSEPVNNLIENITKAWITIIETNIETHDRIVSIVQGFTHLFILLSWASNNTDLISEWQTPELTISDMILENPIHLEKLNKLKNAIKVWENLSKIFLDEVSSLTSIEINNFWTPTFWRVSKFCVNYDIIVNNRMIKMLCEIENKDILVEHILRIKEKKNILN